MASRYVNLSTAPAGEAASDRNGAVQVIELRIPHAIDMYEFDRVNDEIARLTADDRGGRWVLDLAGSQYVGSALLGVLVNIRQRIRGGGGRLAVCNLSDPLAAAMKTCSLHNLFTVAATRADAIRIVKALR